MTKDKTERTVADIAAQTIMVVASFVTAVILCSSIVKLIILIFDVIGWGPLVSAAGIVGAYLWAMVYMLKRS